MYHLSFDVTAMFFSAVDINWNPFLHRQTVLQQREDELQQRHFEIVQKEASMTEWAQYLKEQEALIHQR